MSEKAARDDSRAGSLRRSLSQALAANDVPKAVRDMLAAVRAGEISVPGLYELVLGPLLADIGSAWQHGQEHVWQEHMASAAVRTIVESLYQDVQKNAASGTPRGQVAVLACPPAERHDLGLRMLADRMALAGWTVHFLGASVPEIEIAAAARALEADLVVLTVATHFNLLGLRGTVEHLRTALPEIRVMVGGPAFGPEQDWPPDELLAEQELGIDRDAGEEA